MSFADDREMLLHHLADYILYCDPYCAEEESSVFKAWEDLARYHLQEMGYGDWERLDAAEQLMPLLEEPMVRRVTDLLQ